ncbi:MAG: response regulator [Rhodoferax sp.]|nr:response regulator [Rhodoferax sp.]
MSTQPQPSALRVLAVDDDEINLDIVQELLAQVGVTDVHLAASGLLGLKSLRTLHNVDYVVLDIYMPDMDGIEFIAALAELGYTGALIIVSGVNIETLELTRQLAQASGIRVAAALEKPVQGAALARAMGL